MDGMVFKRLLRRPWLSLVGLFTCGALCLLLCLLTAYRDRQIAQLAEVRDSYEILAVVTDSRGTRSDKLYLSHRYTDFLFDREKGLGRFIREPRLTKEFTYTSPLGTGSVTGVSSEVCADALYQKAGGGWYADRENFFDSDERICLISEEYYSAYQDQEILFQLVDPYGTALGIGQGTVPLRVVGYYRGAGTDVFIPYPASQRIAAGLSEVASTDTAGFLLADNDGIEQLQHAALEMFLPVDPNGYEYGFSIVVHDRQYKATVASMEQNIKRTSMLLPLIALLGLGAGFLLGLLGTRGEIRTYALMRTLGMSGVKLFFTVLFEQLLLPLAASVTVGAAMQKPLPALLFFCCQLFGCLFAVIKPVSAPPTRLLHDQN